MLEQGSIKNRSDLALNLVRGGCGSVETSDAEKDKNEKENGLPDDTGRRFPVNRSFSQHWLSKS